MQQLSERKVISLIRKFESLHKNEKSRNEAELADLIRTISEEISIDLSKTYTEFSLETLLKLPEIALNFQSTHDIAEEHLRYFMTNVKSNGLFYIKAQILWGRMLAIKANNDNLTSSKKMEVIRQAIQHLINAQQTIAEPRNNRKYDFMTYNISRVIYQILKNFFRPGYLAEFATLVEMINANLKVTQEKDYDWKGFFSWLFVYCVKDLEERNQKQSEPGKKPDDKNAKKNTRFRAQLSQLWEESEKKPYSFHEALFRLKVSNADSFNDALSLAKKDKKFIAIAILQSIKSKKIDDNQIENQLNELVKSLMPSNFEEKSINAMSYQFELLAEAARVAAFYGIKKLASKIIELLKKIKSLSPKTILLVEYTKAELLMHTKSEVAENSKAQSNTIPSKDYEIDRRKEALHIIQKALKTKLNYDPLLIYEGCVLIWNISLPFLNENHRSELLKPFQLAARLLEEIESNDFDLRIRFHYELAKIHLDDSPNKNSDSDVIGFLKKIKEHAFKCREFLHYSEDSFDQEKIYNLFDRIQSLESHIKDEPVAKIQYYEGKLAEIASKKENNIHNILFDIQSTIKAIHNKIVSQKFVECSVIPQENIQPNKIHSDMQLSKLSVSEKSRIDLGKESERLYNNSKQQYIYRILGVLYNACRLSFENDFYTMTNEFAANYQKIYLGLIKIPPEWFKDFPIPEFIQADVPQEVGDKINKNQELKIFYVKILYLKSQSLIKLLAERGVDFALVDDPTSSNEADEKIKYEINANFIRGVQLSLEINQTWLVFNGGILIWNVYLPVFKNNQNDARLHPMINELLSKFFDNLKKAFARVEERKIVNYDMDTIIQVYCNISMIYIRLLEQKLNNPDQSNPPISHSDIGKKIKEVIDSLLQVSLTPHTRKMINSILSRVNSQASESKNKNNKADTLNINNQSDQIIFDINSKLETIQNNTVNGKTEEIRLQNIRECFNLLIALHKLCKDELDRELECELWTKLANLAINEDKLETMKLALCCLDYAKDLAGDNVPPNMLKFSSLALLLHAKALCWLVDNNKVEYEQHEIILFRALKKVLDSIEQGIKIKNNKVLEAIKKFYLIVQKIELEHFSFENRQSLIRPIFTLVYFLKASKEISELIYKELENSQMIVNLMQTLLKGCLHVEDYELANMASTLLLEIIFPSLKESIWMIKIVAMTKQQVESTTLLNEIKDCNSKLQCELLQQIAWNTENVQLQYQVFIRAIELTKKENNSSVCQILLNFSEWLFRNNFPLQHIRSNLRHVEEILGNKARNAQQNIDQSNVIFKKENNLKISKNKIKKESLANITIGNINKDLSESKNMMEIFSQENPINILKGNFTVEDCDTMFQLYVTQMLLSQTYQEKKTNAALAIGFIEKTFRSVFEQMNKVSAMYHNDANQGLSKVTSNNFTDFNDLKTFDDWIEMRFTDEYLNQIEKTKTPNSFCKMAYKQPLVTFNHLLVLLEMAEDTYNRRDIAILIRFVGLFGTKIAELSMAVVLAQVFRARSLFNCNQMSQCNQAVNELVNLMMSDADVFEEEFERFSKIHHEVYSKNFQYMSFSSKNKNPHYLNTFHNFEFWIIMAEVLMTIDHYDLAQTLAAKSIQFCQKASAHEYLGRALCVLAKISSDRGEKVHATKMFSEVGKNLKLLKNWQRFIVHSTDHFIGIKQFENASLIIDKFQSVIQQSLDKETFQSNCFIGNQILALIRLIRTNIILEEFKSISRFYPIDSHRAYFENFKKGFSQVLVFINEFNQMNKCYFSTQNVIYFHQLLKKLRNELTRIICSRSDVMDYLYIYTNILVLLIIDTISVMKNETTVEIFFKSQKVEQNDYDDKIRIQENMDATDFALRKGNFEPSSLLHKSQEHTPVGSQTDAADVSSDQILENSNLTMTRLLYQIKMLCTNFMNLALFIEGIYKRLQIKPPNKLETHCQEKILGLTMKAFDFIHQNLTKGEKIETTTAKDVYILGIFNDRSNAYSTYVYSTYEACSELFGHQTFVSGESHALIFRNGARESNIYSILQNQNYRKYWADETALRGTDENFRNSEPTGKLVADEDWPSVQVEPFSVFLSTEYFTYNRSKFLINLMRRQSINDLDRFNVLADYQSIKCQQYLYEYFAQNSTPNNEAKVALDTLMQNSDSPMYEKIFKQYPFLNNLFTLNSLQNKKDKLPKNSLFIIVEPDDISLSLFCGLLYTGENEMTAKYSQIPDLLPTDSAKSESQKGAEDVDRKFENEILMCFKHYLKKLEERMHPDKFEKEKVEEQAQMHKMADFFEDDFGDKNESRKKTLNSNIDTTNNGFENVLHESMMIQNKTSEEIQIDYDELEMLTLEQKVKDLITNIRIFVTEIENKRSEAIQAAPQKNSKAPPAFEPLKFASVYLLFNYQYIQFPLERLILQILEGKADTISKDISFHSLLGKLEKDSAVKSTPYQLGEAFSIINDDIDTAIFEEISQINAKITSIVTDGFDYGSKYVPHPSELQSKLSTSRILLYKGCVDVLETLKKELLLSIAGSIKIDVLMCFDKIKVADAKFIKFQKRIKNGSNFIQFNDLVALSSILNIRCMLIPTQTFSTEQLSSALSGFLSACEEGTGPNASKEPKSLSVILEDKVLQRSFCFIGLSKLSIKKEKKGK